MVVSEAAFDNGVRALPFDVDDKADPAGLMFELRVVQALLLWRPGPQRLAASASVLFFPVHLNI